MFSIMRNNVHKNKTTSTVFREGLAAINRGKEIWNLLRKRIKRLQITVIKTPFTPFTVI